ncbi:MAG: hypothetical protein WBN04_07690 [Paracoccaceae bacterium]
MKRGFLITLLALAGCASPAFLGQPAKEVDVAGSVFRVYMRSGTEQVEAHRISVEPLPGRALTLAKAARAIEIATGCVIRNGSLEGDQAIVSAEVGCTLP